MLVIIVIAAVVVAVFGKTLFKVALAALLIGFVFLTVTGLLDILHGLHRLIP
jgi:hypothetical protein